MDLFQFRTMGSRPAATDSIAVYDAGTTDLVAGLKKMDGSTALANPFTPADAGTVDAWGFMPPAAGPYDIKNLTTNFYFAQRTIFATAPYTSASQAQAEDSGGTTLLSWTSQRIWQAISKWWTGVVGTLVPTAAFGQSGTNHILNDGSQVALKLEVAGAAYEAQIVLSDGDVEITSANGTVYINGYLATRICNGIILGQSDERTDHTAANGAAIDIYYGLGNWHKITCDSGAAFTIDAFTFMPTDLLRGNALTLEIVVGAVVPTITWTGKPADVTAPTFTANSTHLVEIVNSGGSTKIIPIDTGVKWLTA